MRRRIWLAVTAAVVLVDAVVAYTLWEPRRYDLAKVHPDLQALQEPYRKVSIDYYVSEHGAIGVAVTDAGGVEKQFFMPAPETRAAGYQQVLAGVHYPKQPGGVPVPDPEPTRRMLTDIVVRHGDGGPDADMALLALRGHHPLDRFRVWIRRQTE